MEQATLDYFEPIVLEIVKRNPQKFVDLIQSELTYTHTPDWLTTKQLCDKLGTTVSTWSKSDVRYHPVVVNARRTDTAPYKYKSDKLEAIQKVWDERRYRRGKG